MCVTRGPAWTRPIGPARTIPQPTFLWPEALITTWFLGGKTRGIATGVMRFGNEVRTHWVLPTRRKA